MNHGYNMNHGKKKVYKPVDVRRYNGQKYTTEARKKAIQTKVHKKAAMLRKYAKLCRAEGIISDRVNTGTKPKKESSDSSTSSEKSKNISGKDIVKHKIISKAQQAAQTVQQQREAIAAKRQEREAERQAAQRRRRDVTKELNRKTKKGQPVLGNKVKLMLQKLQTKA